MGKKQIDKYKKDTGNETVCLFVWKRRGIYSRKYLENVEDFGCRKKIYGNLVEIKVAGFLSWEVMSGIREQRHERLSF